MGIISKLREEGLWDSLISEGQPVSSAAEQRSPAVIEPSHPTEEHSATHDAPPEEITLAEGLASLSLELGKDDFQVFNALEQKQQLQLDVEFSGDQFEGMTCSVLCSVRSTKQDLQAVGHGTSKVQLILPHLSMSAYVN